MMFTRWQSFRYVTSLTFSSVFCLRINFWGSRYTTFVSSTFPCSSTTTYSYKHRHTVLRYILCTFTILYAACNIGLLVSVLFIDVSSWLINLQHSFKWIYYIFYYYVIKLNKLCQEKNTSSCACKEIYFHF